MSQTKAQLVGGVGISTADNLTIYGNLIGVAATFTGNVSVGGTLIYEDVTNVDSVGLITARSGAIINTGTATTALIVNGDARVTGILTIGTSSVTLNGTSNQVNVGTGVTIHHTNGFQIGANTLHSTGLTVNNINSSGVITATSFVGNGSGLTGAGSTVADDTSTNSTFYPLFTTITSGTVTSSKVSTTKLTFNPSTGRLTATYVNSSSDENLKKDIATVENALDKVKQLRGVDFAWKDSNEKSKGVIAQEIKEVFPELVSEENGVLSVNYNGLIAVLIEAIKDLSDKK